MLGNLAYLHHLLGDPEGVVLPALRSALERGGERLRAIEREDSLRREVSEVDAAFREIVDTTWATILQE